MTVFKKNKIKLFGLTSALIDNVMNWPFYGKSPSDIWLTNSSWLKGAKLRLARSISLMFNVVKESFSTADKVD